MDVCSRELGVSGRTDVLVRTAGGVRIREYKSTPVRREAVVTTGMRVQLALQSLCLEEMGTHVEGTEIYFTDHNVVRDVTLDEADFDTARTSVCAVRDLILSDYAPEPLDDTTRCGNCSHADVCLPDEHRLANARRQIRPRASAGRTVYLSTAGSYACVCKGRMKVSLKGEELAQVPLETVRAVQFIGAKIANQATQIRRAGVDETVVRTLRDYQRQCASVHSIQELLGVEGSAAGVYFSHWKAMIKEPLRQLWAWSGRTGRPATDQINAMLNYAYALLLADEVRAITACGLDPHAGFLHSSCRNKPALALDLMEEVRAPIADSVVQTVINCQMVAPEDFTTVMGSVRMGQKARHKLIEVYERRMETEFEHPLFHYKVTWRRALEIQARQVLGVLERSEDRYVGIRVR